MWEIYTDGGCIGNPGPGGWAFILTKDGKAVEDFGGDPATTNNRMELTAVIRALKRLEEVEPGARAEIHTDSQYVKNGITQWIHAWKLKGWKTASKQPVKNQDLWLALDAQVAGRDIAWKWVKGHAGNPLNERCDSLVHEGISSLG